MTQLAQFLFGNHAVSIMALDDSTGQSGMGSGELTMQG